MKQIINKLLDWVTLISLILFLIISYTEITYRTSFLFIITNFIIIITSYFLLYFGEKKPFSLHKIFYLFSLFFFGLAPLRQYLKGIVLWGGNPFLEKDYVFLNLIIIIILFIYQFLYIFFYKRFRVKVSSKLENYSAIKGLIISGIVVFILLFAVNFNYQSLLFRSESYTNDFFDNQTIRLFLSNFIRPIPFVILLFFTQRKETPKPFWFLFFILAIFSNFPTSRARFYIAAMYIPLIILLLPKFSYLKMSIIKLISIGLLFVYPALDSLRNSTSLLDLELDFIMFIRGHYDSYQMFLRAFSENIITYGNQLLTVLLFFVPRTLWQGKSIGSGYLVSNNLQLSFDNISMNYFGEGFINFGLLGIFLFTILLAYLTSKMDNSFKKNSENLKFNTVYLISLGLLFFLLRGDLLSSFAFSTGIILSVYFTDKLLRF
jgi:hypothetical protein